MFGKVLMSGVLGVAMLSALALAGCQSAGAQGSTSNVASTQAVMCPKCQITWVKVPVDNGKGRIVSYTTRKSMECPDCKSAVENFFSTGKLEHSCKTCGSDLQACEMH